MRPRHIHAFSPLEVHRGAQTLRLPDAEFLAQLRAAGLGSLPGAAAEILDGSTVRWLEVMRAAHRAGLKSTAAIMSGHVDACEHWARRLPRRWRGWPCFQ